MIKSNYCCDMQHELQTKFDNIGCEYILIENENELLNIYNLFMKDIIFEPKTALEILYFGIYFQTIKVNFDLAEKYYLLAVEKGNIAAMRILAFFYDITNNDELSEKYYLMAIEENDTIAINHLAFFYEMRKKL